jgi:hypothetical protein
MGATEDLIKYYYGNSIDLDPVKSKNLESLGYVRTSDPSKLNSNSIVLGGAGAEKGVSDANLNGAYRIAGDDRYATAAQFDKFMNDMTSAPPAYQGLNPQAIADAWLAKTTAGVNQSANQQLTNIQNNLTEILSDLDAEKSGAQSNKEKQLQTIHNNEFATTETQKELMNASGWNMNNSGLAVGEVGKIKVGADKQRSDASGALVEALNDIARRANLANTRAANDTTSVENWKSAELSGAAADALLQANTLGYQQYRDSVSDYQNNRNYDYQVSRGQVTDAQWLKQFTAEEQQRIIDNAIKNRQISVSEGNLALSSAAQAWEKDPNNPDNIYKQKQIENMDKKDTDDPASTIGPLYGSMMNSADPSKWLVDNAMYLTQDELKTLYGMLPKSNTNEVLK